MGGRSSSHGGGQIRHYGNHLCLPAKAEGFAATELGSFPTIVSQPGDRRTTSFRCYYSVGREEMPWTPLVELRCSDPHPVTCTTHSSEGAAKRKGKKWMMRLRSEWSTCTFLLDHEPMDDEKEKEVLQVPRRRAWTLLMCRTPKSRRL